MPKSQLLSFKSINCTSDNYISNTPKKWINNEPVFIFPSALRHIDVYADIQPPFY